MSTNVWLIMVYPTNADALKGCGYRKKGGKSTALYKAFYELGDIVKELEKDLSKRLDPEDIVIVQRYEDMEFVDSPESMQYQVSNKGKGFSADKVEPEIIELMEKLTERRQDAIEVKKQEAADVEEKQHDERLEEFSEDLDDMARTLKRKVAQMETSQIPDRFTLVLFSKNKRGKTVEVHDTNHRDSLTEDELVSCIRDTAKKQKTTAQKQKRRSKNKKKAKDYDFHYY